MNIASTPAIQAAVSATQGPTADIVNILVLRKALDNQAAVAAQLIQSLPTPPTLATSGSIGTRVNAFA